MGRQDVAVNQATGLSCMSVVWELDTELRALLPQVWSELWIVKHVRLNPPKTTLYSPAGFPSGVVSKASYSR